MNESVHFPSYSNGDWARHYGNPRKSNPHPADSWEAQSWDAGWEDADKRLSLAQEQRESNKLPQD